MEKLKKQNAELKEKLEKVSELAEQALKREQEEKENLKKEYKEERVHSAQSDRNYQLMDYATSFIWRDALQEIASNKKEDNENSNYLMVKREILEQILEASFKIYDNSNIIDDTKNYSLAQFIYYLISLELWPKTLNINLEDSNIYKQITTLAQFNAEYDLQDRKIEEKEKEFKKLKEECKYYQHSMHKLSIDIDCVQSLEYYAENKTPLINPPKEEPKKEHILKPIKQEYEQEDIPF